ncbi:MAG TPA: sulfite exporter TauE/SafE family protein [Burkholderiaceae bacterium]|nr:sulfite exporter TauE/SafE family protein [Burkholderiaceae bacterium]HMX10810.1 sulfite exporter TauE/SafE family protein [Burkholderiaceae bacterium]HMZ00231.1 sulfite exporter TauE/SafE family protein [Burkholderiaceae bacterium]HNB43451.1 sulfite exporter TauE/SafE family protein [Burkholderiaceae bacterium]HNG80004.1 sulfite exporter TauE/SafE family protein [Burkholderiaceae bacterium]
MTLDSSTWLLLALAALGAGALNAIAGGGSFLTFPALVFAGVPPIAANATSAVAVSPGYLGSTLGFRSELVALPRALLVQEGLICAVGGVAGALLLLVTPAKVFSAVVPWLLLFATAVFALGPKLVALLRARGGAAGGAGHGLLRPVGLFAVAVYGGYFNGGLGILLMALYALVGEARIHTANALKNLNSLLLSLLSVVAFAWAGAVHWPQALWMAAWATAGGFVGARLARRLPATAVRAIVIVTGLLMVAVFFLR